jgi:hypothetical protein
MNRIIFVLSIFLSVKVGLAQGKPNFWQLTVEQRVEPLGIDVVKPRFGWNIQSKERGYKQAAWQVQVASTLPLLKQGKPDIWDSQKNSGDKQNFIEFQGKDLRSAQRYFWRIKVWDNNGTASDWSEPASFTTGILQSKEWESAKWIAYEVLPKELQVMPGVHLSGDHLGEKGVKRAVIPLFRKPFELDKEVKQALLFVAGLGHYEARLNGEKVGSDFLAPGWTNYEKRCLYNTYDVTKQVKQGENMIGAIVGTGFMYINRERYRKMVRAEAFPMLRLKLIVHYADGTTKEINTDESWKTSPSPITFSSIYGGEDYDATKEQAGWDDRRFDDASWKKIVLTDGPGGEMFAQQDYPLKVMQVFDVKEKKQITTHKMLYDFGQNASGIIRLKAKGKKGQRIKIIPAEVLDDGGMPYQKASGAPYYFEYTLKGNALETWEPRFTYYGFRYALVEIEGEGAVDLNLQLLHTRNSTPTVGSFSCSNPLFNQIDELIKWGIKSNLASVATDCPHREKLGWLEQTHLIGSSMKYNFDIYHLYNKVVDDMMEGQLSNGLVPDIVPEYVPFEGGFRDSPEWGSASIIIPWYLYQWYGDKRVLEKAYPMMKRYITYLGTKANNDILSHGLGDWFDLGPKDPGVSQLTPIALTATATYYYDADILSKIAFTLGNKEDAAIFTQLATSIKNAFNATFFDSQKNVYATGSQTSYSMPLYMGMVDEAAKVKVSANLMDSIRANNKALTAGDVGYRYLLRALEEAGASQLIYEMNNRADVPGYGYQIKHGATALTESWAALKYVSNNHMMLGHLMEWFYSGLGGIKQQEGDVGFKKIVIAPAIVEGLDWANVTYHSINGEITVHWRKEKEKISIKVSIPANTEAQIRLPAFSKIYEGNKPLATNKWIKNIGEQNGENLLNVVSGNYDFTLIK